ncbi:hypothetical protein [Streptodolium elevatio]|uniref:HNH endonuclease n=1 Tax=Streptodolium elevatio TaxID=3157996 RepID=A0ABV3DJX4_9ACTN
MTIRVYGDPAANRWYPRQRTQWTCSDELQPGTIVVWEREPHRVIEVRERPDELWGDKFEQAWQERGRGDRSTWRYRPVVVVLQPDEQPTAKPLHLCGPANHQWWVLPEHYAICRICRELPPCRHEITEGHISFQMKRTTELLAIPRGHCLACGEAITRRMNAARFPGPNLWRPDLGDNSAVFHARAACAEGRAEYKAQWDARGDDADEQLSIDPPDTGGPA